jgi:uncharacterized protein
VSHSVIPRPQSLQALRTLIRRNPVVVLAGGRQVGKTTLARSVARSWDGPSVFFDLEDPADRVKLSDPLAALENRRGLVVLDGVHRRPEIFRSVRTLFDRGRRPRILAVSSAEASALRDFPPSLVRRLVTFTLHGLTIAEVGLRHWRALWLGGGLPRAFGVERESHSYSLAWRNDLVREYLERDLPQLGFFTPEPTLRRFITALAEGHGRPLNHAALARSIGVSDQSVRHLLDVLSSTFMVHRLRPWQLRTRKRQVQAPRVYFTDTGLLHALLGIETERDLARHGVAETSWQWLAMREVVAQLGAHPEECFFWATHHGAKLDLLVVRGERRRGFQFVRADAPKMRQSMRIAFHDLHLDSLEVIHAGYKSFPLSHPLSPQIRAVPLLRVWREVEPL